MEEEEETFSLPLLDVGIAVLDYICNIDESFVCKSVYNMDIGNYILLARLLPL